MIIMLRIIGVYLSIAVIFLIYFWLNMKFNKKVRAYFDEQFNRLTTTYPNFSSDTIYSMLIAHFVRQGIFWPGLLYTYFFKGGKRHD